MDIENIKEKRLYFLFSKLKDKYSNNVHFSLIVDTFLSNGNSFSNLFDISQQLMSIGINIQPEALELITKNKTHLPYFEIPDTFNFSTPFKLRKIHYTNLSSYKNYYDKLNDYILNFLKDSNVDNSKSEIIKEILLTTLFRRNLAFLKQLINSKDANELENLLVLDKHDHYDVEDCTIYNNMILTSGEELNSIIRVLLYKIFDFLQLHYNPSIDKTLNETYKNKVFYLDSSFIIRLFGFDNELREHRAKALIDILKNIEGVKFLIHNSTLTETQQNIKNLIDRVHKLLGHSEKTLLKIEEIGNKRNNVIDLYLRLKKKGKVSSKEDFVLHFSNVLSKLKSLINSSSVARDDNRIVYSTEKRENLLNALSNTEKTSSRINHISKLLLYIDNLREANNHNIYDIKYWLITTDNATLKTDAKIKNLSKDNSRSVCILPTELLRTISNRTEISADYIEVFKQFMVYSNTFAEQYTDVEIDTINKVVTLAEAANTKEYDVDYYITNLFDEINLEDLISRLKKFEDVEKQNEELVKIFEETFGGPYREKYFDLIKRRKQIKSFFSKGLRFFAFFSIPVVTFVVFLKYVINPELIIVDPLTYIHLDNWNNLNYLFLIIQLGLIPLAFKLNKNYGSRLENYIFKRLLNKNEA